MKLKNYALTLSIILPIFSNADTLPFPTNEKGIVYTDQKEINTPNNFKNENLKNKIEIQEKGYVLRKEPYAKVLINYKSEAKKQIDEHDSTIDQGDSYMRSTSKKINLSIDFKKVPGINEENVYGYAGVGSYVKNLGWDGLVEFFYDKNLGNCKYQKNKILAIYINKNTNQFLVNDKPTSYLVTGNDKDGFLYGINWYKSINNNTIVYMYTLECAKENFDKDNLNNIINLAKKIDNNE